MGVTLRQIRTRLGNRGLAAAVGLLLALVVLFATPQLLGTRVAAAFGTLDHADAKLLWLAGVGFALAVVGAAGSWRSAIGLCGGRLSLTDACARYGAGSLVNTFVPARAGDAVRIALFSRVLPNRERLWTTGSACAALGAARAAVIAALVVAGALAGFVPVWPLLVALGLVAVGVGAALRARNSQAGGRLSHLLDAFRELGRRPSGAARLVAWIALSTAGRLAAATAVGAGIVPITPGNFGVTSGAIAIAFHANGVSFTHGLAAGIAFHAVETAVGIMFGLGSLVWLAPYPTPAFRRVALLATAASWSVGIAGAFSATVLVPLV